MFAAAQYSGIILWQADGIFSSDDKICSRVSRQRQRCQGQRGGQAGTTTDMHLELLLTKRATAGRAGAAQLAVARIERSFGLVNQQGPPDTAGPE